MNCNVHVFYKMIFCNKFGFILETSLFLYLHLLLPVALTLLDNSYLCSWHVRRLSPLFSFCFNSIAEPFRNKKPLANIFVQLGFPSNITLDILTLPNFFKNHCGRLYFDSLVAKP